MVTRFVPTKRPTELKANKTLHVSATANVLQEPGTGPRESPAASGSRHPVSDTGDQAEATAQEQGRTPRPPPRPDGRESWGLRSVRFAKSLTPGPPAALPGTQ